MRAKPILFVVLLFSFAFALAQKVELRTRPMTPVVHTLGAGLLIRPDVQQGLKLTPAQRKTLDKALIDYKDKTKAATPERSARLAAVDGIIKKTLSSAQLSRLKQLFFQIQGGFALTGAEVSKTLRITEAQKKQIMQIRVRGIQRFQQQREKQGANYKPDPRITADIKRQLEGVLTPAQAKKWKAMKGKPFKFSDNGG